MAETKKFDFEFKLLANLRKELRNNIVDIEGKSINHEEFDPLSFVCVKISNNPGVVPVILRNSEEFFRFGEQIAEETGFNIDDYHKRLADKFS